MIDHDYSPWFYNLQSRTKRFKVNNTNWLSKTIRLIYKEIKLITENILERKETDESDESFLQLQGKR